MGKASGDRDMPEERNRVLIDHLSGLCCAPTSGNAANNHAARQATGAAARRPDTGNRGVAADHQRHASLTFRNGGSPWEGMPVIRRSTDLLHGGERG
jgi:hypothetical protein